MKYTNKVWFFLHFLSIENIIEYAFYVINVYMKKIIKQLWQLIFRHRKKLIYGAFAFLISQICFFDLWWIWIGNEVYAVDSNTTSQSDVFQEKATEWYEKISFFQKVIYVVLYPLLVVAWKLVDNSLVYWEVFGFDTVLWQLWNIVKNLANFALWFLVVYKIFDFLINWQKSWEMKEILISWLIAWVWIQASRFVMAALIDVSTILTYGVWWLPINILKENSSGTDDETLKHNPYVYKNVVYLDLNDIESYGTYLTNQSWDHYGDYYISDCRRFSYVYDNGAKSEELLLAPKMIYYADENGKVHGTESWACHAFGQVYDFQSLYDGPNAISRRTCSNLEECKSEQINYNTNLGDAESEITSNKVDFNQVVSYIKDAKLLEIWDAHSTWGIVGGLNIHYDKDFQYWLDNYNKRHWEWKTSRLQDILDWNSYVWVFTALYSSLMSSTWIIPSDAWIFASLLSATLSLGHMLAIAIPLIAVAIVFMMRIWIIRVAVAIAPFIVLLTAFKVNGKRISDTVFKGDFWENFQLKNLIIIIFIPAIICFAISVSTILVTIINNLNVDGVITEPSEILGWLVKINIWGLTVPIWKLIVAVFGIAITWFLLRTAIKTSKLWRWIVNNIKWLAEKALWSIPIVPVVWRDADWKLTTTMVWTNTAFGNGNGDWWIISKMMKKQISEYNQKDAEVIDSIMDPDKVKQNRELLDKDNAYKDTIKTITSLQTNWTTQEIEIKSKDGNGTEKHTFINVDNSRKKEIIEAINGLDENRRVEFWNSQKTIKFNNGTKDVTYEFNSTDKKYEEKV